LKRLLEEFQPVVISNRKQVMGIEA
jgi:hypothetical protein